MACNGPRLLWQLGGSSRTSSLAFRRQLLQLLGMLIPTYLPVLRPAMAAVLQIDLPAGFAARGGQGADAPTRLAISSSLRVIGRKSAQKPGCMPWPSGDRQATRCLARVLLVGGRELDEVAATSFASSLRSPNFRGEEAPLILVLHQTSSQDEVAIFYQEGGPSPDLLPGWKPVHRSRA
jgi:hypothetical protein